MAAAGGEHVGEAVTSISVEGIFEDVRKQLGPELAGRWQTRTEVARIEAPRQALVQMVENIARNGFDACKEGLVSLEVRPSGDAVELCFVDEGQGMSPEVVERATDPFFTTKNAGDRMGLGLFLGRALVDSLGGQLLIESAMDEGTTIRVILPQRS